MSAWRTTEDGRKEERSPLAHWAQTDLWPGTEERGEGAVGSRAREKKKTDRGEEGTQPGKEKKRSRKTTLKVRSRPVHVESGGLRGPEWSNGIEQETISSVEREEAAREFTKGTFRLVRRRGRGPGIHH